MNAINYLVLLCFSTLGYGIEFVTPQSSDKKVTTDDLKRLRHELFVVGGYDKYARPIPAKDQLRVTLSVNLINVRDLCMRTQTLTTDLWIFLQWHDEGLKWDGKAEFNHIKSLHVPINEIYKPDIMSYNEVDHTSVKLHETNAILYSNGMTLWVPPFTSKALCQLNLKKWPFDEHICFLKFGSWTHDGTIMDVKYSNTTGMKDFLGDYTKNPTFDVEFLNVTNKDTIYPCCKEPYPSVTFYFKLKRKPTLYPYIISMPALVAIISSLVTFWFPIRSYIRFVLNGMSLLTLTLLLLHIGTELGFSSMNVPIGVRYLSLTALFIGIIQIWFTIGYNISLLTCKIPLWTIKLTKPVVQLYKHSEKEVMHLTQTEQSPDVSKKELSPTTEDLIFVLDKIVFVLFILGLTLNCYV